MGIFFILGFFWALSSLGPNYRKMHTLWSNFKLEAVVLVVMSMQKSLEKAEREREREGGI